MKNILLVSKENYEISGANVLRRETYDELDIEPDIVILDLELESSKPLLAFFSPEKYELICLAKPDEIGELTRRGIKVLPKPVDVKILQNEINLLYETKKRLKELHEENLELKKNLYQIDAFYNASSKFAGTLDKNKLYEVMFETFERVLSFDVACALFKDNIQKDSTKFYIHSLKKVTDELNGALAKRLLLAAKNEGINLKSSNNEILETVKPSYKNEFFDFSIINFDTLFAPIIIKDKFEGVIEIFRKTPFTKEDATCFQSIVHQVLAPLRSAILYEDIINANEKLKKLEKMKSEFVSIVSHELRTPLTPINNALSIILSEQGGKIGDTNKNFANIAKRNISRLSGIIEDLLDLSRMQTGKFDFKFKKTEILPSLELVYKTFKNQALAKNIKFGFKYDSELPPVYADSHRLDQIFSNLVTNALKFTQSGGKIKLTAELVKDINRDVLIFPSRETYGGLYVKVSVTDTGVGIEKEDIPKIFDKFSQIENSLSRNTGGIGLGLTITKHFIDAHLGGIWVNSRKNEGSTFNVILPVYSENSAFEADLNLKIQSTGNVAYFEINEPKEGGFFEYLKKQNILKFAKTGEEVVLNSDNRKISRVFIAGIDKSAFDFIGAKIAEEINDCDIVLLKKYYKKENN